MEDDQIKYLGKSLINVGQNVLRGINALGKCVLLSAIILSASNILAAYIV